MISLQNAGRAAALTGNVNQVYSGLSLNTSMDILMDTFTLEATDTTNTFADFVPFIAEGYIDLALSRVRIGGLITNALSSTIQLQKVTLGTTFVGTTTASSTAVTTTQTGLLVGMVVSGTGITAGATITAITATGFTLSAATAATGFGVLTLVASGAANISAALVIGAIAGNTAATAAQAVPFVPLDGGAPVTFAKGDKLRLVLTSVTSAGAGRTLLPQIPVVHRRAPGLVP
jgi:hypothetical protein